MPTLLSVISAVNEKDTPGHKGILVRCQKNNFVGDVFGRSHSLHRMNRGDGFFAVRTRINRSFDNVG